MFQALRNHCHQRRNHKKDGHKKPLPSSIRGCMLLPIRWRWQGARNICCLKSPKVHTTKINQVSLHKFLTIMKSWKWTSNRWKQKKTLTVSVEELTEGCWPTCCTGITGGALWLPEDSQGCPWPGAAGACIWGIGWNWDIELALFCGWTKDDGAYWNMENWVSTWKMYNTCSVKPTEAHMIKWYWSHLTEYDEEKGIAAPGKPGIWLAKGAADCGGPGAIGLVWMYDICKPCDEGITWPGWLGLGGYCCIGCENCSGWLWAGGIPMFGGGIPCPTGWNCCEDEINGCPCWFGTIGRNCGREIQTNSNQESLIKKNKKIKRIKTEMLTWTEKQFLYRWYPKLRHPQENNWRWFKTNLCKQVKNLYTLYVSGK